MCTGLASMQISFQQSLECRKTVFLQTVKVKISLLPEKITYRHNAARYYNTRNVLNVRNLVLLIRRHLK